MASLPNVKVQYRYRDKSGSLTIPLSTTVENMARQIAVLVTPVPAIVHHSDMAACPQAGASHGMPAARSAECAAWAGNDCSRAHEPADRFQGRAA